MGDWRRWRDTVAEQTQLREWRREGALDAAAHAGARDALGPAPDTALWRWFLDRFALWLGIALCAAGAICFIAANWEHLGKFTRLYGMQALVIAAVAVAARLGLARLGGQAALWLAMVLLGLSFDAKSRTSRDGYAVFALAADGVGRFVRVQPAPRPVALGEIAVRYRERGWGMRIASNAWFFPEGQGECYAPAKYGELRVDADGTALLAGMRGENRKPL